MSLSIRQQVTPLDIFCASYTIPRKDSIRYTSSLLAFSSTGSSYKRTASFLLFTTLIELIILNLYYSSIELPEVVIQSISFN